MRIKNKAILWTVLIVLVLHITLSCPPSLLWWDTSIGYCGGPGTTGATFLKLGVGARPSAMGEAFTAVSDDVNAMYWNPAGLAQITNRQVSLIQTIWFQSIYYEYLGYCQPLGGVGASAPSNEPKGSTPGSSNFGVLGVSATFLWIDGIERRASDTPDPDGWIPARDLAVSVSYGRCLTKTLDLGLTLKGLYRQLDDRTSTGAALDIGLLYKLGSEKWTLGVALQNLGYESAFISEQDQLPMNLKIGISNKYLPDNELQSKLCHYKLTIAADFNYGIMDSIWSVGGGIDWWLHPMFAVRGGYKYNSAMSSL